MWTVILFILHQIPLLVKLFDKLYSLTNLLVVQPENLKQVCSEEQLVSAWSPGLSVFARLSQLCQCLLICLEARSVFTFNTRTTQN